MTTLAELKANFYDNQRQAANMFEAIVAEVVALNTKAKIEEENQAKDPKKAN